MVLEPLVGAQREHHLGLRQGAVLERDRGVLGLRAFSYATSVMIPVTTADVDEPS